MLKIQWGSNSSPLLPLRTPMCTIILSWYHLNPQLAPDTQRITTTCRLWRAPLQADVPTMKGAMLYYHGRRSLWKCRWGTKTDLHFTDVRKIVLKVDKYSLYRAYTSKIMWRTLQSWHCYANNNLINLTFVFVLYLIKHTLQSYNTFTTVIRFNRQIKV